MSTQPQFDFMSPDGAPKPRTPAAKKKAPDMAKASGAHICWDCGLQVHQALQAGRTPPAPPRAQFLCRSRDGTEALYCYEHAAAFRQREGMSAMPPRGFA